MKMQKYVAELLATFALTMAVLSPDALLNLGFQTAAMAAFTVMLFVYTIGPISGAHINPAVTFGLWSVKKISFKEGAFYIIAQVLGAVLAGLALKANVGGTVFASADNLSVYAGELIGAFVLVFGVSSVVFGKVKDTQSGIVIGGSLLVGILLASNFGGGVLNPAVAIGVGSVSLVHIFAPLVGGVFGASVYRWITR